MLLSSKVAIITGAGRGIGKEIALEFAREGATVNIVDIQANEGNETINELRNTNSQGDFYQADVSNYDMANKIIEAIINKYKRIDILVNNAGKGQRKPFLEINEQIWDQTIAVNCKSVFNYCHAAAKWMAKQREGCIINIGSVAAIRGGGLLSKNAYVAAKGAVISLTKGFAK
jgi:3-oxoacyl-[acyl-carrier protein] reductase